MPKQLHYIVSILESHQLVKKQSFSSEKKRSVIHLSRYAYKKRTLIEDLCEYLFLRHFKEKKSRKSPPSDQTGAFYYDTSANIKKVLAIGNKRFKTTINSAEKQNIIKREFVEIKCKVKSSPRLKAKPVRVFKLTESYFNSMLSDNAAFKKLKENDLDEELEQPNITTTTTSATTNNNNHEDPDDEDGHELSSVSAEFVKQYLGSKQTYMTPMYTQIFAKIEEHGKEGISLKELGTLFGLDFYKSRRMGGHLQAYPDIVTIIKETTRMRAKYQTIMLRKFLHAKQQGYFLKLIKTNCQSIDLPKNWEIFLILKISYHSLNEWY